MLKHWILPPFSSTVGMRGVAQWLSTFGPLRDLFLDTLRRKRCGGRRTFAPIRLSCISPDGFGQSVLRLLLPCNIDIMHELGTNLPELIYRHIEFRNCMSTKILSIQKLQERSRSCPAQVFLQRRGHVKA
jgi:hypothetical protein